jgi:hypothetical protein
LCCLALMACEGPSLIVLQNPKTGQIVPCGPTPDAASEHPALDAQRCADTYQRQGYVRLPIEVQPAHPIGGPVEP